MQCRSCGTQLPEGAAYCPGCAAPTPYGISQSGTTPYDPTSASPSPFATSSLPFPSSPPPPTSYGLPSYEGMQPNPYELPNPYTDAEQPSMPHTTPGQGKKKRTMLAVLITLVVLLSIVGGTLGVLLSHSMQYPFSTQLVLNDPLSDGSRIHLYGWAINNDLNSSCAFVNGAYESTAHRNRSYCVARRASFANFTYEVQMTIRSGGVGAMGGVIFRHIMGTGKDYMFLLGANGSYALDVTSSYIAESILRSDVIPGFATGLNRTHSIGIVANGPQISIYVDQKFIVQVADSTYTRGQIGVLSSYGTASTIVDYTNAKVWQL